MVEVNFQQNAEVALTVLKLTLPGRIAMAEATGADSANVGFVLPCAARRAEARDFKSTRRGLSIAIVFKISIPPGARPHSLSIPNLNPTHNTIPNPNHNPNLNLTITPNRKPNLLP